MLASVQVITSLSPIDGADRIETARILGWDCVVKKGEFHVNDLVVFIEPDTIIPKWFLTDIPTDTEEIRLKVIKMKKQISQGLVLPVCKFGNLPGEVIVEGADVSEIIGVKKYEKFIPAHMQGLAAGNWPFFIPKTDEPRGQSVPYMLQDLRDHPYIITVKLDGTSCTMYKHEGEFHVCSRNVLFKSEEDKSYFESNVYWKMAHKYKVYDVLPDGLAVQGEIVGPGIQGNPLGLLEYEFHVFNFYDIKNKEYVGMEDTFDLAISMGLLSVPMYTYGSDFNLTIEQLLNMTNQVTYPNESRAEGIVVRPAREMKSSKYGERISFKVVNPEYMLKNNE